MKKVGYFENSDFIDVYVGLSEVNELATDITVAFNIYAEALFDCVRVRKTPIVEDSDIKEIKRYVDRWIKIKKEI